MKKIIKNTTGSDISFAAGGFTVPANGELEISILNYGLITTPNFTSEITPFIEDGDIVINDGEDDLPSEVGLAHIASIQGVIREHGDITLLPAVGENAPEIAKISNALIGSCLIEGEEIFGQTRIDNLAGGDVVFQMHLVIDNSTADRWVQYDVSYFTTTGLDEKPGNVTDGVVTIGPVEVPTTPFGIFEVSTVIPASAWEAGEKYLFVGVKRVAATGKTAPTNHPITLRYCKQYYKLLES